MAVQNKSGNTRTIETGGTDSFLTAKLPWEKGLTYEQTATGMRIRYYGETRHVETPEEAKEVARGFIHEY